MKIKIDRDILNNKINLVLKAVASKGTMPILEYILLTANSSGFKMLSNDLKLSIETNFIECDVIEMGVIALEAKYFSEIIKKLPSGILTLEVIDNDVKITSGKVKINFKGLEGDDFPSIPDVLEHNTLTLSAKDFNELIKKTIFSVAQDDSKPILTGELFEISNNTLKVVAVDGFRISFGLKNIDKSEDFSVVIPEKPLKEISKIFATENDLSIKMIFSNSFVKFVTEECTIVSRLLEGDFIKFNQLFVDSYKTKVICKRSDIKDALERTLLIVRDAKRVPVKFSIKDSYIELTSNTENGNFFEEVSILFEGDDLDIGFNPKYVIDILNAIDCEEVSFEFTNNLSPCIIKGIDNDDFKYIVLPLRIE